MILRSYQITAIDRLSQSVKEHRRSVLVAPTGAGKTVIASEIIRRCVEKNHKILFLAHRRELIEQCSDKLTALDVEHGIVKAGMDDRLMPHLPVQVASVQTLYARIHKANRWTPEATIVICDEAHRIIGKTWRNVLDHYRDAAVIGLTATPYRTDGTGLGRVFNDLVTVAHIDELIEQGYLINPDLYVGITPNLDGVKQTGGDYQIDELTRVMDTESLIGNVVESWKKYAANTPTVLFACGVEHSLHFVDRFREIGVTCEHVDGMMSEHDRMDTINRFRRGETTVLCNCNILTEGFDLPSLVTCVIARPTKSAGLYRQMVGRVMRPTDGKKRAIIIDHAGCIWEHGRPDDRVEFTLDDKKKKKKRTTFICLVCFEAYSAVDIVEDDRGLKFTPCGHLHSETASEATHSTTRGAVKAEIDGIMIDLTEISRRLNSMHCAHCESKDVRRWKSFTKKRVRYIHAHCTKCGSFSSEEEHTLWKRLTPKIYARKN